MDRKPPARHDRGNDSSAEGGVQNESEGNAFNLRELMEVISALAVSQSQQAVVDQEPETLRDTLNSERLSVMLESLRLFDVDGIGEYGHGAGGTSLAEEQDSFYSRLLSQLHEFGHLVAHEDLAGDIEYQALVNDTNELITAEEKSCEDEAQERDIDRITGHNAGLPSLEDGSQTTDRNEGLPSLEDSGEGTNPTSATVVDHAPIHALEEPTSTAEGAPSDAIFDRATLQSIVENIPSEVRSLEGLLESLPREQDESPDLSMFRDALSTLVSTTRPGTSSVESWISGQHLLDLSILLWDYSTNAPSTRRQEAIDNFAARVQERMRSLLPIRPRTDLDVNVTVQPPPTGQAAAEGNKKASNRPDNYHKDEDVFFPKRLLEKVDLHTIKASKKIAAALKDSERTALKVKRNKTIEEGGGDSRKKSGLTTQKRRGSYKCNLCGLAEKPHDCPFVRIPRQELEQIRDHIPDLPAEWHAILDRYRELDRDRSELGDNGLEDKKPASKVDTKEPDLGEKESSVAPPEDSVMENEEPNQTSVESSETSPHVASVPTTEVDSTRRGIDSDEEESEDSVPKKRRMS